MVEGVIGDGMWRGGVYIMYKILGFREHGDGVTKIQHLKGDSQLNPEDLSRHGGARVQKPSKSPLGIISIVYAGLCASK